MNVYEAIRDYLLNSMYSELGNDSRLILGKLLIAYDALAPDWSNAPDDAKWYTIDNDGDYCWHDVEPVLTINRWYSRNYYASGTIDLPIGIDWRLCKWQRPADEPETMHYAIYGPMD